MTLAKKISAVVTQCLPTIVNGIQVSNLLFNFIKVSQLLAADANIEYSVID